MIQHVTPMIHVPDVSATVDWYRDIGFTVTETYDNGCGGLSFAILSFGTTQVMFNQGGRRSSERRREVDLYTYTEDVDRLYERIKDRVEIVEGLHDTFYGMREFIIRDINRFWITFAEQSTFGILMNGIREGNLELVQAALKRGGVNPHSLTIALVAASSGEFENPEIAEMLTNAGAVLPPAIDERELQSYAGHYESDQGMKVDILLENGKLVAMLEGQQQIKLMAINQTTFRPIIFDGVTLSFKVEQGKTQSFQFKQGSQVTDLKRADVG
jgi:uncharacterized glyoxalase superfamily protein PhnB